MIATTTTTTTVDFGMTVVLTFLSGVRTLNNVTEVHYMYNGRESAFESDIHSTGLTVFTNTILEMEIRSAESKADAFEVW